MLFVRHIRIAYISFLYGLMSFPWIGTRNSIMIYQVRNIKHFQSLRNWGPSSMGSKYLQQQLTKMRQRRLAEPLAPEILRAKNQVVAWQIERLNCTYADLRADPQSRSTVEFFLKECYADRDFQQRNFELERISALLARFLPASALQYIAQVLEMNNLTEEMDTRMAYVLEAHPEFDYPAFDPSIWAEICRKCDDEPQRRRLVWLTWDGGKRLDAITGNPGLVIAMRLARRPAELAGVGELYRILRQGYDAFRVMHNAEAFLKTLVSRESQMLDGIWG